MNEKILIVGTGAVGGFYGALLGKAGAEVSVVCRSDYDAVSARGITVDSTNLGRWTFTPSRVLREAAEYGGGFPDYVILCCKVLEGLDRPTLIRDAVGENTRIVLIQNGIEIEPEIASAFPDNELISGLAFICASRPGPGKVTHTAYGRLAMGLYPDGISDSVKTLCQLFEKAGIVCEATEDIIAARWRKCLWNASFNPLSVLSGGLDTLATLSNQEALVRGIMEEVCAIAAALGHRLAADVIETNVANTYDMPPYKTSMLLDFKAGRPMETEAILGNAVRAGRRAGVAVPRLETLYGVMKLRELTR
ncbi:MAG: 2-dehydropantoate 2-reductase [Pseudomonadota bacterium]